MAVQVVEEKSGGLLGGLGNILSLAGMVIPGAQWMSALGQGLGAVNGLAQGNPSGLASTMSGIQAAGGFQNWVNPGQNQGNVYKPASVNPWQRTFEDEAAKRGYRGF
jgi:hypothetical protein